MDETADTPQTEDNACDVPEVSDFVALADGAIKVTLTGGQQVRIRGLDLNDMADFETEFGSMEDAFRGEDRRQMAAMRNMLWRSLRKEQPDLTEHDVGALFEISDFAQDADGDDDGIAIKIINRLVEGPKAEGGNRAARRAAAKAARRDGQNSTSTTPTESDGA